ncbi:hypothetical protein B0H13DRAFT_1665456, partial [Mycena leptocephala]
AFSLAGITISKRRNRLKADIVEALQVLKCMIRRDLIFQKSALADDAEDDSEKEENEGWDALLADDPDNYDPDYEMNI